MPLGTLCRPTPAARGARFHRLGRLRSQTFQQICRAEKCADASVGARDTGTCAAGRGTRNHYAVFCNTSSQAARFPRTISVAFGPAYALCADLLARCILHAVRLDFPGSAPDEVRGGRTAGRERE